jgi:hypothetical protein
VDIFPKAWIETVTRFATRVDLHSAVRRFAAFKHENLPVLAGPPPSAMVGILEHHCVLKAYDDEVERIRNG